MIKQVLRNCDFVQNLGFSNKIRCTLWYWISYELFVLLGFSTFIRFFFYLYGTFFDKWGLFSFLFSADKISWSGILEVVLMILWFQRIEKYMIGFHHQRVGRNGVQMHQKVMSFLTNAFLWIQNWLGRNSNSMVKFWAKKLKVSTMVKISLVVQASVEDYLKSHFPRLLFHVTSQITSLMIFQKSNNWMNFSCTSVTSGINLMPLRNHVVSNVL